MVAIVIMMVGLLGLLESINIATEYNLKNHLRDEAVYVGEKYLNALKGQQFDNVAPVYPATSIAFPLISTASRIRGSAKKLIVETSSTALAWDASHKASTLQLNVLVKWTYKGVTFENRLQVPYSKMPQ